MDQMERLYTTARVGMLLDNPWYGQLALRLTMVPDPNIKYGVTNGSELRLNPEWFCGLSAEGRKAVLSTAVTKCALSHHVRIGERDVSVWNKASDMAVHDILSQSGIQPVDTHPSAPPGYDDSEAEKIYRVLQEQESDPNGEGSGDGSGDSQDQGGGRAQGDAGDGDSQGSGVGMEQPAPGEGQSQDSANSESGSEWQIAAVQAAKTAKAMGKSSAWMDALVEAVARPRVDWRTLLRDFIDMAMSDDYSWAVPSRRHLHRRLYLPSMYSEEMRPIAVVFGTSGSVSDEEFAQFVGELNSILEDCDITTVHVYHVDAEVNYHGELTEEDLPLPDKVKRYGYGGTSFAPAFNDLVENDIDVACIIYLTDMECNDFADDPGVPVLWISTGADSAWAQTPPYGEVVDLL